MQFLLSEYFLSWSFLGQYFLSKYVLSIPLADVSVTTSKMCGIQKMYKSDLYMGVMVKILSVVSQLIFSI